MELAQVASTSLSVGMGYHHSVHHGLELNPEVCPLRLGLLVDEDLENPVVEG